MLSGNFPCNPVEFRSSNSKEDILRYLGIVEEILTFLSESLLKLVEFRRRLLKTCDPRLEVNRFHERSRETRLGRNEISEGIWPEKREFEMLRCVI